MKAPTLRSGSNLLLVAAGACLAAAVTGLALAGWMRHGADMFLAMAQAGLSWCF
jgi:hypothetical protein